MIPVTKSFLPDEECYQRFISQVWKNGWLTNRGEFVLELEHKLKEYLDVPNIIAMTNGTLPLQIAIKALELTGEIITTPFSYVATTSSIVWEGCKPVFVDIDPEYFTIDENLIEAAITSNTTGILATHVYGNPCNIEVIQKIAEKYDLKIIYDAAHCFGVEYLGKSIFNYGDISTCSFHATKIFHTGEGGALFSSDKNLNDTCFHLHNFGHKGYEDFYGIGINAKMSELQASMGLAVFPHIQEIINKREILVSLYKEKLKELEIQLLKIRPGTKWNSSYFPVVFNSENVLLKVKAALEEEMIFTRRYFYPSLNNLSYVPNFSCPVSDSISKRILCLPIYAGLDVQDINRIVEILNKEIC